MDIGSYILDLPMSVYITIAAVWIIILIIIILFKVPKAGSLLFSTLGMLSTCAFFVINQAYQMDHGGRSISEEFICSKNLASEESCALKRNERVTPNLSRIDQTIVGYADEEIQYIDSVSKGKLIKQAKGDSEDSKKAQWVLGYAYLYGIPTLKKDVREAERNLRNLAFDGDSRAQTDLGVIYFYYGEEFDTPKGNGIDLLRRAVAKGNSRAQYILGEILLKGKLGYPQDVQEGINLLSAASSKGNVYAKVALAYFYADENAGIYKNYELSRQLFTEAAADKKHPYGETALGVAYLDGLADFPKRPKEAVGLIREAAEKHDSAGELNIGLLYFNGVPGELDKNEDFAIEYLERAANHNNAEAQAHLGYFYVTTKEPKYKNRKKEGKNLLILSAQAKNPRGQAYLGYAYRNGLGGLGKKEDLAQQYCDLAAKQGDAIGQWCMAVAYHKGLKKAENKFSEARRLYQLSADQNYPDGQLGLGILYEQGLGGAKDLRRAFNLYRSAAPYLPEAKFHLAEMYYYGRGMPHSDQIEAMKLYKEAARLGNVHAKHRLDELDRSAWLEKSRREIVSFTDGAAKKIKSLF